MMHSTIKVFPFLLIVMDIRFSSLPTGRLGALLMTSLIYAMVRLYNEREERLNGIVFGDIIEAAGYWCGIYSGQYWYQKYIGNRLDRFTKWVAR